MLLKDYIPNLDKKYNNIFFSGISSDSSTVSKKHIFFAIKGNKLDGYNYINQAIKKGANVIITERNIIKKKENVIFLRSSNVRKLLAKVSYKILNKKPKKLVAVTGTNGKSSIADFFYQILNLNSKKVASIGTIGIRHKDKKKNFKKYNFRPNSTELYNKRSNKKKN